MDFFFSMTRTVSGPPGIHLLQDNVWNRHRAPWDDYGYIVTFQVLLVWEGKVTALGETKVLVKGVKNTSVFFVGEGEQLEDVKSYKLNGLLDSEKVVSLATTVDFYQRLRAVFSGEQAEDYLVGVCDAGYFYNSYDVFKSWPGFAESILRDGQPAEARIKKGFSIALGSYLRDAKIRLVVDTLPSSFEKVEFNFESGDKLGSANVNLIIGANGSGKSHILKHVSELLTGVSDAKKIWPYFHKLVVVAYSPFERFYTDREILEVLLKKQTPENLKARQLAPGQKKRLLKVNKYSYIGFRNESDRFSLEWPKEHSARSVMKIMHYDQDNWWGGRHRLSVLIDTLKISVGFDALALKLKTGEFLKVEDKYDSTLKDVEKSVDFKAGVFFLKNDVVISLSSGQIMYSYMIPALVSEIEEESLLIIDEPELYLHPSLEVGLISMLKSLLNETSSYAIIATHSAILAREVSQEGIKILRSSTAGTMVDSPDFETYGESLDLILGAAFGDYDTPKPFQAALDEEAKKYVEVDQALKELGAHLGDEALVYVASKYEQGDPEIIFEDE